MLPRPIPAGLRVVAPVEGRMQARLRVRMVSADSNGRRLRIPNPGRVVGFECGLHLRLWTASDGLLKPQAIIFY